MIHRIRALAPQLAVALAVAPLLSAPLPLTAQDGPRVSVAIPDDFPAIDASAIVVRDGPRDVILLKESEASPETLFVALGVLRRARADRPLPAAGEMLPVLAYALDTVLSARDRDRFESTLRRLANARRGDLGSWGAGRVVRMTGG